MNAGLRCKILKHLQEKCGQSILTSFAINRSARKNVPGATIAGNPANVGVSIE
jgi:hypothetical protein